MTSDPAEKTSPRPSPVRLVPAAVTALGCYALHFFPLNLLAAEKVVGLPVAVVAIGLALALRIILPRFSPKAYRIIGTIYYLGVVAYTLIVGYFVYLLDAPVAGLALALAVVLALVFYRFPERRWPMLFVAAVLLAFLLFGLRSNEARVLGVLAFAIALPGLIWATPKSIGRMALLTAAVLSLLLLRFGGFYFGGDTSALPRVEMQDGVESVFTIKDNDSYFAHFFGDQLRFAADVPAAKATVLGSRGGAYYFRSDMPQPQAIFAGVTSDKMAYDLKRGRVLIGDYEHASLVSIDAEELAVRQRFPAGGRALATVWVDARQHEAITMDDFTREIGVFDLSDETSPVFLPTTANRDAFRDERTGNLIASTLWRVRWFDGETGAMVRELKCPSMHIRLEPDPARRKLYVSLFTAGELWRANLDTGKVEAKLKLAPGVRFLKLAEGGQTLFVANYFTGEIYRVQTAAWRVDRTIFAGSRVRSLHIAPGEKKLVFASSLGAFRYRF